VGNYEYEMPENEIHKMFYEYGDIDRIDMKTGDYSGAAFWEG